MNPWSDFKYEKDLANNGQWFDYGESRFLLRSTESEYYKRERDKTFKKYKRQINQDSMSEDQARDLLADVYSRSIVLAWFCKEYGDGFTQSETGEKLPFSSENAKRLFISIPKLFDAVQEDSNTLAFFQKTEEEGDVKNSLTYLNTNSPQEKMQKK